jgi:hypothetical protein
VRSAKAEPDDGRRAKERHLAPARAPRRRPHREPVPLGTPGTHASTSSPSLDSLRRRRILRSVSVSPSRVQYGSASISHFSRSRRSGGSSGVGPQPAGLPSPCASPSPNGSPSETRPASWKVLPQEGLAKAPPLRVRLCRRLVTLPSGTEVSLRSTRRSPNRPPPRTAFNTHPRRPLAGHPRLRRHPQFEGENNFHGEIFQHRSSPAALALSRSGPPGSCSARSGLAAPLPRKKTQCAFPDACLSSPRRFFPSRSPSSSPLPLALRTHLSPG